MAELNLIKLAPNLIQKVEKEKLTFIIVAKADYQSGMEAFLIAYGKDPSDESVGFMMKEKFSLAERWTTRDTGWADRCSPDSRWVTVDEAYKIPVKILNVLSAEKFNGLNDENEDLFDYELATLKEEIFKQFDTEELPETHDIVFVAVMNKGKT